MKTMQILASATVATAADALRAARERNWSDASILKHAPECVKRLIIAPVVLAQPTLATVVTRSTPVTPIKAPAPKRAPAPGAIVGTKSVILTPYEGDQFTATLTVHKARPKVHGEGMTIPCSLAANGRQQVMTLTPDALERLLDNGIVLVGWQGKRYRMTAFALKLA